LFIFPLPFSLPCPLGFWFAFIPSLITGLNGILSGLAKVTTAGKDLYSSAEVGFSIISI